MITSVQSLPPNAIGGYEKVQSDFKKVKKEAGEQAVRMAALEDRSKVDSTTENIKKNDKNNKNNNTNKLTFQELGDKVKSMLKDERLSIEFSMDKDSKKMIMKVIDAETKEVVQQYPPEISLKIARIVSSSIENGQVANAKV